MANSARPAVATPASGRHHDGAPPYPARIAIRREAATTAMAAPNSFAPAASAASTSMRPNAPSSEIGTASSPIRSREMPRLGPDEAAPPADARFSAGFGEG